MAAKCDQWWRATPIIERHDGALVVRDDLIAGGSKIRFLPYIVAGYGELVFGGPYCGGAPYALSVWGARMGVKVTLFYAKRKALHWRQKAALRNGAQIFQVPAGRMSVVQARARRYCAETGAHMLPLGFDVQNATAPFEAVMREVREQVGHVDEVWCAVGSGMLARCLANAFIDATIYGVTVGLKSRHGAQAFPRNVRLVDCKYDFAEPSDTAAPFDACRNYEAKAWEVMAAKRKGTCLFWNVLGDKEPIQ